MSTPAKPIARLPADPVRTHDDPLGKVAWLAGGGVVLALCVLATLAFASRPIRSALAVLRDGGAVRTTAPVRTAPSLAQPEARARAARDVRSALLPIFRRDRESLRAVLGHAPTGTPWRAAQRLQTWARLREAWAKELGRIGLSPTDYRRAARKAPPGGSDAADLRAIDRLLGVEALGPPEEALAEDGVPDRLWGLSSWQNDGPRHRHPGRAEREPGSTAHARRRRPRVRGRPSAP